jgi:predicted ATPase/class 3 adenylate cyclase
MAQLPTGTVTFLFTDIAGSTRLLQQLGNRYAEALGQHQALLRSAFTAHGGVEVDTQGDAFFVAFASAPAAVAAAAEATRALAEHAWPEGTSLHVRMGLHTGTPQLVGDHYVGLDVHRAARIAAAAHGGQVLLSQTTRDLVEDQLPVGDTLRDLGPHRFKDMQHAEQVYQLVVSGLQADFPPLNTLDTHPHNLPIQPTPLLGRAESVAAVCALLLRGEGVRLVTLTGPGGIGKTRLAIQVAAELVDEFVDGVWFVRLSLLTDPTLVVLTIAQTLGLKEVGSHPIADTLQEHLRTKRTLLVLDNCEQIVGAAPEVASLLAVCPGVRVLATSRIPLRLRGEKAYTVAPLPLATPGDARVPERLAQYAAVALFIERAHDAHHDFTVTAANAPAIAAVCARLEGLPLAIELAAARARVLPPEALLARLSAQLKVLTGGPRDLEERQQTMRATIAWSEALLSEQERMLFRRLAVFVGGCTLESAEAVCVAPSGAVPLDLDVLEGLSTLVDHSLVQQREEGSEPRFGMAHVIREYALEQLEANGEAEALYRTHAQSLVTMGAVSPVGMRAGSDARWLARAEREHDNVRAALGWTLDRGEVHLSLRLGVGVAPFWWARGYYGEGRRWMTRVAAGGHASVNVAEPSVAAEAPDRADMVLRAWALWWAGKLAWNQDDIEPARAWARQCLAAARASGDAAVAAATLSYAGCVELAPPPGSARRGAELLAEAATLAHRSRDHEVLVRVLGDTFNLRVGTAPGLEEARGLSQELLEAARHLDTLTRLNVEAHVDAALAVVAQREGDVSSARTYAERTLRTVREHGFMVWAANCLEVLAWVADRMGVGERAARLLGASAREGERQGIVGYVEQLEHEAAQASTRAALGKEAWAAAFAAGKALTLEQAIAEALETTGG